MECYIVRRRKRKQEKGLRRMCVVARRESWELGSEASEDLTEEVTSESNPEGGEGKYHMVSARSFQAQGTVPAKSLKQREG